VAVFMIWSLTFRNLRHINIEKILHRVQRIDRNINTCIYQLEQLWWVLYSRECGEGLTDVKSEGAEIENV
jgi:hypothetical protein